VSLNINERVAVVVAFGEKASPMTPARLRWNNKEYELGKIDFHHTTRDGHHTVHHFSLTDQAQSMYMKLAFHSHSLVWTLEEIEPCQ
jgi:hypothetical protein